MKKLRIGYIGAGNFTNRRNFPHLAEHNVELVVICDLIEEKALKAQQQYGFQKVYTDFEKMCDQEDLDAVFCVGPHRVHYAVGMKILERGLPLYTQKPPAANGQMAQEMADLAKAKGVVYHVGFTLRSSPAFRDMKRIIDSPEFGKPTGCIVRYLVRPGADLRASAIDMNSHAVDAGRFLMGDIKELKVVGVGKQPGKRNYVATAVFENGGLGTFNFFSDLHSASMCSFEVIGEGAWPEGRMLISGSTTGGRYYAPESPRGGLPIGELKEGEGTHHASGSWGDVESFLNAVRGIAPSVSPIESAAKTMHDVDNIIAQLEALGGA
ncbi:MAG: Gfo/Idh/MocA family oxidoreductase [Armatimonadetes bacterium]|nr:Gfo/Idh/MocA family oxidoreductase [Armatimonadota bacterium]